MRFTTSILLIVATFSIFPSISIAGCWEITSRDGKVSKADEIWHIKNKLAGMSMLLVRVNGKDESILTDSIRSIRISPPKEGWRNFLGSGNASGEITLTNGNKRRFESNLNLMTLTGDEQLNLPLTTIRTIRKCKKPLVTEKMATKQPEVIYVEARIPITHSPDVDVIYMVNGDILSGAIQTNDFLWTASFATIRIEKHQVKHMTLKRENSAFGLLILLTGDEVNGVLDTNQIKVKLSLGQTIDIKTEQIKAIRFSEPKKQVNPSPTGS